MALRYRSPFQLVKTSLPHVTITLIVIGYLFLGAAVFLYLEKDFEVEQKQNGLRQFRLDFDNLTDFIVDLMNATDEALELMDNRSTRYKLVSRAKSQLPTELWRFLINWESASREYSLVAEELFEADLHTKWSFPESVLFTFSLITTIGMLLTQNWIINVIPYHWVLKAMAVLHLLAWVAGCFVFSTDFWGFPSP